MDNSPCTLSTMHKSWNFNVFKHYPQLQRALIPQLSTIYPQLYPSYPHCFPHNVENYTSVIQERRSGTPAAQRNANVHRTSQSENKPFLTGQPPHRNLRTMNKIPYPYGAASSPSCRTHGRPGWANTMRRSVQIILPNARPRELAQHLCDAAYKQQHFQIIPSHNPRNVRKPMVIYVSAARTTANNSTSFLLPSPRKTRPSSRVLLFHHQFHHQSYRN